MKLSVISKITISIPVSAIIKRYAAIDSRCFSLFSFVDLNDAKEKIQENVKMAAIIEVSSSIINVVSRFEIWIEVITNRQNPNRFAEVPRICCEVLLAITQN